MDMGRRAGEKKITHDRCVKKKDRPRRQKDNVQKQITMKHKHSVKRHHQHTIKCANKWFTAAGLKQYRTVLGLKMSAYVKHEL